MKSSVLITIAMCALLMTACNSPFGKKTAVATVENNIAPLAESKSVTVLEDGEIISNVTYIDVDGAGRGTGAKFTVLSQPTKGVIDFFNEQTGEFKYRTLPNQNGGDRFEYLAYDEYGKSAPAIVNITITPVNDAPTNARAAALVVAEDSGATNQTNALMVDDIDGPQKFFSVGVANLEVRTAANVLLGTVSITDSTNGSYTFTAAANANGSGNFQFTASDGAASVTGTVQVTVTAVNDAPLLANSSFFTYSINGSLNDRVQAPTDIDSATFTYTVTSPPAVGTLNLNSATGTFVFTFPDLVDVDVTTFKYIANDGALNSNEATGTINIIRPPAFVTIVLSGGAQTAANLLPLDTNGTKLASYSLLGMGQSPLVSDNFGALWNGNTTDLSKSKILQALLELGPTIGQKLKVAGIATRANADSTANMLDASNMANRVGLQGKWLGALSYGTTFQSFPAPTYTAINANTAINELISKNISANQFDPRLNSQIASIWGLAENSSTNSRSFIEAFLVNSALKEYSGAVSINRQGFDYHSGIRQQAQDKDYEAGTLISQMIRTADVLQRRLFIYVATDGGNTTGSLNAGNEAGYVGDTNDTMLLIISYDPVAGAVTKKDNKLIGSWNATQTVAGSLFENPVKAAAAAVVNYLSLTGYYTNLESNLDVLNMAEKDAASKFQRMPSSTPSTTVTFSSIFGLQGSITPKCINCHGPVNQVVPGFDITVYNSVLGKVAPSNPDQSLIYNRTAGKTMPPNTPLSDTEILAIRAWIAQGALNN